MYLHQLVAWPLLVLPVTENHNTKTSFQTEISHQAVFHTHHQHNSRTSLMYCRCHLQVHKTRPCMYKYRDIHEVTCHLHLFSAMRMLLLTAMSVCMTSVVSQA